MNPIVVLFFGALFFMGGFGFAKLLGSNPAAANQRARELSELRNMRDELTHVAVDHVTTEPLAVIVLDIIRDHEKRVGKPE